MINQIAKAPTKVTSTSKSTVTYKSSTLPQSNNITSTQYTPQSSKTPIWKRYQYPKHLGTWTNRYQQKCIIGTNLLHNDTHCPNYQVWNETHACSLCGVQFHGAMRCPKNPRKIEE